MRWRGGRSRRLLAVAMAAAATCALLGPLQGGGVAAATDPHPSLVDPWQARRVPLTLNLRRDAPTYPGDPPFEYEVAVDDRGHHPGAGYLLEVVTSLGTHTASHISAPAHFVRGGATIDQLDERFTLTPVAVVDVRSQISGRGPDFFVTRAALRAWERAHGRIPAGASVLLLTGASRRFHEPGGDDSPYTRLSTPGFDRAAVEWLFDARHVVAVGADALGPDATFDADLQASSAALGRGGITIENVGPRLRELRPLGDALLVNCNRPLGFSGFQCGFTGLAAPRR